MATQAETAKKLENIDTIKQLAQQLAEIVEEYETKVSTGGLSINAAYNDATSCIDSGLTDQARKCMRLLAVELDIKIDY